MIYAENCPRCCSQANWTSKRTDKGRKVAIAIRCECRYLKTEIPIAEYMDVARLVEVLEAMRDEWNTSNEIEKKEKCRRMMERVHGDDKEFDKKYAERQEGIHYTASDSLFRDDKCLPPIPEEDKEGNEE